MSVNSAWKDWLAKVETAAKKEANCMEKGLARRAFVSGFAAGMLATLDVVVVPDVHHLDALKKDLLSAVERLEQPEENPPAVEQVWRDPEGRKMTLSMARVGILREIGWEGWAFVCESPHGEATPDFSYTCFSSYCRCVQ